MFKAFLPKPVTHTAHCILTIALSMLRAFGAVGRTII
jgi:hypothetical protein